MLQAQIQTRCVCKVQQNLAKKKAPGYGGKWRAFVRHKSHGRTGTPDLASLAAAYREYCVMVYSWIKLGLEVGSEIVTRKSVATLYSGEKASRKIVLSWPIHIGRFS